MLLHVPLNGVRKENDELMGHQHDHEVSHDEGKGHSDKGEHMDTQGSKDNEAGGGRREHRASGSHSYNASGTHGRDRSTRTSGGGSRGGGGGTHGRGTNVGHS